MKVNYKISFLLVCLISFCSVVKSTPIYAESHYNTYISTNINKYNEIFRTLNGYFEERFKYQNDLSNTNKSLNFINPSKSIYEKVRITDDGLRKLFISSNQKIDGYNINTTINKLKNNNEDYEVNVTYRIDFYYGGENEKSQIEEKHIIHLKTVNNNLFIVADIFDEDDLDTINKEYINNEKKFDIKQKIETNQIKSNNENMIINLNNENNKSLNYNLKNFSFKSTNTYNREGAKGWALRNALTLKNDYTADCTNFVSKAMKYGGGMKEDNIWYYHSNAWIRVKELRNWLVNKGYAQEKDNYKYAYIGDIIQYKNKSNNWNHSVIVTDRFNSYPYVRVSAHSNNRRNVNVSGLYYPKGEFKSYRVLHITR